MSRQGARCTTGGEAQERTPMQADYEAGFEVLIAGGGVAGAEGLLALRKLLGGRAAITMLSPQSEFVYRPLAVIEPFGLGHAHRLRLDRFCKEHGARFDQAALSAVDPERRLVTTAAGDELRYDALLLGIGVRSVEGLRGALTYGTANANAAFAALLEELERGTISRLVFASPPTVRWSLPLYELALLASYFASERGLEAELTLVSPEARPLEMFGRRASASVSELFDEAGVEFRGSSAPSAVEDGEVALASGERLGADRVIALPRLEVPRIPGIPQGPGGFIGTDMHMQVEELARVYAAGDATWFPVKQGGLAAQQADVAASAIASIVDRSIVKESFVPVLRAAILTGAAPRYVRAAVGDRAHSSASGAAPLWWPPSKIAARHLAPYLASEAQSVDEPLPLEDLPPLHGEDAASTAAEHEEIVELALSMAD